jgi:hypothetical protein
MSNRKVVLALGVLAGIVILWTVVKAVQWLNKQTWFPTI